MRFAPHPGAVIFAVMNLPTDRFENVHQVGGITSATLNNGPGRGSRIAQVNTGAGLRYTVALDRGADLVEAHHNQHALAYLTQNRTKPPSHAVHRDAEWLVNWPGGLLTTCGPEHFGHPREEATGPSPLHGRYSNQPAEVEMLVNPDPHQNKHEMLISAITRDTRGYGPNLEVRRMIQSVLGENRIRLFDQTTNRDPVPNAFGLLYHMNFGWPLLDEGSRLILSGRIDPWPDAMQEAPLPDDVDGYKHVLGPQADWADKSRGCIITPEADDQGNAHVGVMNESLQLAVEIAFPVRHVPRVMVWQHYAPGMYVCGMEPMVGTPFGAATEPEHALTLEPGETRPTEVLITVHSDPESLRLFAGYDQPLRSA